MRVTLKDVSKKYLSVSAIENINLDVKDGEIFVLLGPTGCGKTTILRCIAGLEKPTNGLILFNGQDFTHIPVQNRSCTMVFQNYNLFPHLNVEKNIFYGLKAAEYKRTNFVHKILLLLSNSSPVKDISIKNRINWILDMLRLSAYRKRNPAELSGGQRQRVAIARALMIKPELLLLDEPLSALDKNFRLEIREKIKEIVKTEKITMVYVTHDQEEAFAIADRVALIKHGKIVETGTPDSLYTVPQHEYTAHFFGIRNVFTGNYISKNGEHFITIVDGISIKTLQLPMPERTDIRIMIRPEAIRIEKDTNTGEHPRKGYNKFNGKIIKKTHLGAIVKFIVEVDKIHFTVVALRQDENRFLCEADDVIVYIPESQIHVITNGQIVT